VEKLTSEFYLYFLQVEEHGMNVKSFNGAIADNKFPRLVAVQVKKKKKKYVCRHKSRPFTTTSFIIPISSRT